MNIYLINLIIINLNYKAKISWSTLIKLVGISWECHHRLWVSLTRLGPIDRHSDMETFLQSAWFAHGPVPPVHLAAAGWAAEELIWLGVIPLEESLASVAAEDLVVPPPRQVTTYLTFGQGEVHGWVVTVTILVTSSVKHCHLWIVYNFQVFAELFWITTFRV